MRNVNESLINCLANLHNGHEVGPAQASGAGQHTLSITNR